MNTKECRHCKQPIHPQARVCQHCTRTQSWFGTQSDPRSVLVVMGVVVAIFVPLMIWFPGFLVRSIEASDSPTLVVGETSVRYVDTPAGARVFVLGKVQNTSRVDASRIWFRVDLYDASDHLLDTLLEEQSGLVVAGSASKPFRVSSYVSPSPKEVKRVAVTVERARGRARYD